MNSNRSIAIGRQEHQQRKITLILQIFWTFLKIGPITFGGGYAMIPAIEREVVKKHKWMNHEDMTDILAVARSVPGAIAINSATLIGYGLAGFWGAIAAMAGILVSTFVFMMMLSLFFVAFRDNAKVHAAFEAVRATIVALIAYAAIKIGKTALIDKTTTVIMLIAVLLLLTGLIHPFLIIIGGGVLGIVAVRIRKALGFSTLLNPPQSRKYKYDDYFIGDGI